MNKNYPMKRFILLTILGIGFSINAQNIVTEAPSISASAITVPEGQFQIEATFTHETYPNSTLDYRSFGLPSMLIRYGLMENFELRVSAMPNYYIAPFSSILIPKNTFNLKNLGIGLKYGFMKDKSQAMQFSLIGHFVFPYIYDLSGDARVVNSTNGSVIGSGKYSFSELHSVGANVMWSMTNYSGSELYVKSTIMTEQISIIYNFAGINRMTLFLEGFGNLQQETRFIGTDDPVLDTGYEYGFDIGLQYLIREHFQVDIAAGYELDHERLFNSIGVDILF